LKAASAVGSTSDDAGLVDGAVGDPGSNVANCEGAACLVTDDVGLPGAARGGLKAPDAPLGDDEGRAAASVGLAGADAGCPDGSVEVPEDDADLAIDARHVAASSVARAA
jgi:hypothetical protein